jgi:hypothetical protein
LRCTAVVLKGHAEAKRSETHPMRLILNNLKRRAALSRIVEGV